jgi:hypothetical protein
VTGSHKGRLFLLPPLQDSSHLLWRTDRLADYCYWLCPECSQAYTIEREGTALIVSKREQAGIQAATPPKLTVATCQQR